MILDLFFISCLTALVMLVWFHTEAFLEYATLFSGNRFFLVDDFRKKQEEAGFPAPHMDYVNYLMTYHDCFLVRLITCPVCLSFWITLITCFCMGSWMLFPICCLLGLVIYKVVAKIILSW